MKATISKTEQGPNAREDVDASAAVACFRQRRHDFHIGDQQSFSMSKRSA
jgi:hypothetical protein